MENELLSLEHLSLSYGRRRVVADVSFAVTAGETLAVVGESGCGKTSLLKAILGISELEVGITGGRILYQGRDLARLPVRERRRILGKELCMIFQDPGYAFNPIRSYGVQFTEMLKSHDRFAGESSYREILDCFESLMLPDGERILKSCPYEMSGGMNQRIAIASALLMRPKLLLLDEPTSALDVTTQKIVLEELLRLKSLTGMALVLVTHSLGVAGMIADRVGVMYAGRLVEYGGKENVLSAPAHPYTRSLIHAMPRPDGQMPEGLDGVPPLYGAELPGCPFAERCRFAGGGCENQPYSMKKIAPDHWAACGEGYHA